MFYTIATFRKVAAELAKKLPQGAGNVEMTSGDDWVNAMFMVPCDPLAPVRVDVLARVSSPTSFEGSIRVKRWGQPPIDLRRRFLEFPRLHRWFSEQDLAAMIGKLPKTASLTERVVARFVAG